MTAALLVVAPVALLVIVGTFYFVGCSLDVEGLEHRNGRGFVLYSDEDVIKHPDCVAYWPLSDSFGQSTALDVVGKKLMHEHSGSYRNLDTDPDLFKCPGYVVNADIPITTPEAPGTQTVGAEGIVRGDTVEPHDPFNPIETTCMRTDGGFVSIDANSDCNPPQFSFECWVSPEWDEGGEGATRSVFDARHQAGADRFGYAVMCGDDGNWKALIFHSGASALLTITGSKAAIAKSSHLVLTFDGTKAALFVNGAEAASAALPADGAFTPNTVGRLVIGVGYPYLTDRKPGVPEPPPPLFPIVPFKGRIQNVAIYKAVLSDSTINSHWTHGTGHAG